MSDGCSWGLFVQGRSVQLQRDCDLLLSVKTASDLTPPSIVAPHFKQNISKNNTTHRKIGMANISPSKSEYTDIICVLQVNLRACRV
jgi:hypothetical protein